MSIEQGSQIQNIAIPDRRFTRLLDGITGAKRLQPLVLDVMNAFKAEGQEELTSDSIYNGLKERYPNKHVKIQTVWRALDGLEVSGLVTQRHVFATEAIETNTHTGPRYRRVENPTEASSK